jgi:hypothetical protein
MNKKAPTEDLRSNGLHVRHASQVNVVVFCVTAVVPKRDELIAVGKPRRSGAGKYQPREFVALGPREGEVAPKTAGSFILPAICGGGNTKRGRLISSSAFVDNRRPFNNNKKLAQRESTRWRDLPRDKA